MKGRDLLILAAVLLVGGFAVADALRGDDGAGERPPDAAGTTTGTETSGVEVEVLPEDDLGRALFPEVPGAGGSLVLTQTGSCAVREFHLPDGRELPNVVARSSCQLWAAPLTAKVAVGTGALVGDAQPFRILDLSRSGRNLGSSEAAFGFLVWSPDGQRAAWCSRRRVGIDYEPGRGRRRLAECPAAYTPEGEVAFAIGDRVEVSGRTVLTASGAVTAVRYGTDGSVAVVVEGRAIERYEDGLLTSALELPERFHGRLPVLSPDNCRALFRAGDGLRLLDVGCASAIELEPEAFAGHSAAWSPDGRWLAVGGPANLTLYDLVGGRPPVTWPLGAVEIAWRVR